MELAKLEAWKQQAIQKVIMQEKMVEQAKAQVAQIEGRIAERREMFAEAEKAKPKPAEKTVGKIEKKLADKARTGTSPQS